MSVIGGARDIPCPCGSERPMSECHAPEIRERGFVYFETGPAAAGFMLPGVDVPAVVPAGLLIGKLAGELPEHGLRFDEQYPAEVDCVSRRIAAHGAAIAYCRARLESSPEQRKLKVVLRLLDNAGWCLVASTYALRAGLVFQSGVLVRNVIEMAASAIAIDKHPEDLTRLEAGNYDSGGAIGEAKRSLPYIGRIYGHFSEHFAHLGGLATANWAMRDMCEGGTAVALGFGNLDMGLEALEVSTELVLYDYLPAHQRVLKEPPDLFVVQPFPPNPLNRHGRG